jgi:hypothetical protein
MTQVVVMRRMQAAGVDAFGGQVHTLELAGGGVGGGGEGGG